MCYAATVLGPLGVLIDVAPRESDGELIRVLSSVEEDTRVAIERAVYSVLMQAGQWAQWDAMDVLKGLPDMIVPGDWLSKVTILVSFAPLDVIPRGTSVGLAVAVAMASWLTGYAARRNVVFTGAVRSHHSFSSRCNLLVLSICLESGTITIEDCTRFQSSFSVDCVILVMGVK